MQAPIGESSACGASGKFGLDAKVGAAPIAERFHKWHELLTLTAEGIGDLGRDGWGGMAHENAIGSKQAQLFAEDFFGDFGELFVKLGKASRTEGEMPEDLHLPLSREHVDGSLNGAAVMIFHDGDLLPELMGAGGTYVFVRSSARPPVVIP